MDSVAERIFALAEKQFPEQKAFAQEIDETPSKVSQWRTGITKSYMKKLPKIATALGTSVDYLLTGETNSSSASQVNRIFYLLDKLGMEQKAFATAIGTTDKTVSTWRTGRTKSFQKYLPTIATILGTTVDYLILGEKKEPTTVSGDGQGTGDVEFDAILKQLDRDDLELLKVQAALMAKRKQKK